MKNKIKNILDIYIEDKDFYIGAFWGALSMLLVLLVALIVYFIVQAYVQDNIPVPTEPVLITLLSIVSLF